MACESIILNRVDLPKMHPILTVQALKAIGATGASAYGFLLDGVSYSLRAGALVSAYASEAEIGRVADLLKRAYSAEVVKYAAARNGWTARAVGAFQFEVVK